ncbi:hypothetical protein DYB30_007000 [Aphanomyces astaci]|uniref:Helicase ATP-binding domain-containing protein n=2 Tax=Aphanomyces astaci TaxID=112090 RepID=A0A397DHD3_APHAT|nr:hypothetical protein DYB30_007000 [Aphanomyces astaci]
MEFKRWCPGFKVMTYYGSAKRRKELRYYTCILGWSKVNAFQVCITSYQLVVADAPCFKRKKWYYLILDEAHNIKNWKSQRWQTLLTFNTQRRLLLTGTPLQNNLMELWALMHFLMPHLFRSRAQFSHWFSTPMNAMVEGEAAVNDQLVSRLHNIIRPFVLRRLKKDVAKQMPGKFEHVVVCSLSKRQRFLYEDFMARSSTRKALSGGNFMGMMNVLMQLRKVCNHPDLFEARPVLCPFDMAPLTVSYPFTNLAVVGRHLLCFVHKARTTAPTLVVGSTLSAGRVQDALHSKETNDQTRDVHIYRLVSAHTVEQNILKKARQKKHLDFLVLSEGQFTTEYFSKSNLRALIGRDHDADDVASISSNDNNAADMRTIQDAMAQCEDEADVAAMKGVELEQEAAKAQDETFDDEENAVVDTVSATASGEAVEASASLRPIDQYAITYRCTTDPLFDGSVVDVLPVDYAEEEVELERIEAMKVVDEEMAIQDGDLIVAGNMYCLER